MPKKEFNIRNYSKLMFALCTAGGVAVVAANFVQYMVQQQYQNIAYIATYGFVLLIAVKPSGPVTLRTYSALAVVVQEMLVPVTVTTG